MPTLDAAKIRAAREAANLTQLDLAFRLGVTDAAVCQWETAKRTPWKSHWPRIAAALGCSLDSLMVDGMPEGPEPSHWSPWEPA